MGYLRKNQKPMYKNLIIAFFISVFISSCLNGKSEMDFVKASIETVNNSLFVNQEELDTVYINTNELYTRFVDTVVENTCFIFMPSKESLFMVGANYWFDILNYRTEDSKIIIEYCNNSFSKLENKEYFTGTIEFRATKDNLKLLENEFKIIQYQEISELDIQTSGKSHRKKLHVVECHDFHLINPTGRDYQEFGDTLIGNWQSKSERDYYEYLFINDTIFGYSSIMGKELSLPYSITDRELIITRPYGKKLYRKINPIDFNTIEMIGRDTMKISENIDTVVNVVVRLYRIMDDGTKFSDIKCWTDIETEEGEYISSKEQDEFIRGFHKRNNDWKH